MPMPSDEPKGEGGLAGWRALQARVGSPGLAFFFFFCPCPGLFSFLVAVAVVIIMIIMTTVRGPPRELDRYDHWVVTGDWDWDGYWAWEVAPLGPLRWKRV